MFRQLTTIQTIFLVALAYFVINGLTQFFVSGVVSYDQAEQMVDAQAFLMGYGPQPPLYNWIMHGVFELLGTNLVWLLLFKAFILSFFILALILSGKELRFDSQQQWITALSVGMMPFIIWDGQRDLTHSILSMVIASWLLLFVLKLIHQATLKNYLWVGFFCGIGLLTKYNFLLFIAALALTLALHKSTRHLVFNPRLLLSIAITTVIIAPHLIWAVQNFEHAVAGTNKLKMANDALKGFSALLEALIIFVTPLWIAALFILPFNKSAYAIKQSTQSKFLLTLLMVVTAILITLILSTQSSNFKVHWLLPLLFFVPLIIAHFHHPKRRKGFILTALFFLLLVAAILPMRTVVDRHIEIKADKSSVPWQSHFSELPLNSKPDLIIGLTNRVTGNAKQAFPQALVIDPGFHPDAVKQQAQQAKHILIVCPSADCYPQIKNTLQFADIQISESTQLHQSIQFIDSNKTRADYLYWTAIQR